MSVKAIILKYDTFVSPEYITEAMPKWVENFEYVELEANHWAILSQAEKWQLIFANLLTRRANK